MPNLVISLAHTGCLAKAFAGQRHRGKLCSVNFRMALAVPNDVCRWHHAALKLRPPYGRCRGKSRHRKPHSVGHPTDSGSGM
jgi:hypothetical protein